MRLLLTSHSLLSDSPAGVERFVADEAAALQQRGHEVAVLAALSDPAQPQGALLRRGSVYRIVENYPYRPLAEQLERPVVDRALREVLDEFRPDWVHIHHLDRLSLSLPGLAQQAGARVALHLHDYWLLCPAGGQLRHPDGALCDPIPAPQRCAACHARAGDRRGQLERMGLGAASWLARQGLDPTWPGRLFSALPGRLRRGLKRLNQLRPAGPAASAPASPTAGPMLRRRARVEELLRGADLLLAPSQDLAERFGRLAGQRPRVLQNGTGTRAVPPDASLIERWPGGALRLLFVGSLVPHKGLAVVAEALSSLRGVHLLAVGPEIEPGFRAHCERLAAGRLRAVGPVAPEEVPRWMASAELLVLPSLWFENAPLTALEARAQRLPVLASAIGGIPELIEQGRDGWLVPAGSVADWRAALADLDRQRLAALSPAPPRSTARVMDALIRQLEAA